MEYTKEDQRELGKARRLRPTESDFKGKRGYWKKYTGGKNSDGTPHYEWGYKFKPNDGHGKLTKAASSVWEAMLPSVRADNERMQKMQARIERIPLKSPNGIEYVPADKVESAQRTNGWGRRPTFGYSRRFAEAWDRIFGGKG